MGGGPLQTKCDEGMTTWSFFHCYIDYYNAFVKGGVEFNNFMKKVFCIKLYSPH